MMMMLLRRATPWFLLLSLSACNFQKSLSQVELQDLYTVPLAPPDKPLHVFHLGHSLVNRDMPLMLQQLAGPGHDHRSQLGWGASLQSHWEPDIPVKGSEMENNYARYEDARSAIDSGRFDALVLTEAVEIKDSIKYFDSPKYVRLWTKAARASNPQARVYLYETWHPLDDPKGWLERLDEDLPKHWEGVLLAKALAYGDTAGPVHVIPAGQVLGQFVRAVESKGGVGNVRSRTDLFIRNADGTQDKIHMNDLGNYLVALTHYAVLYHRPPPAIAPPLLKADGTPANLPDEAAARLMSEIVWNVVTRYVKTGVATP